MNPERYASPVQAVAASLVGCIVRHQGAAGRIVETEAYHETEPACHAWVGVTARTEPLFGPPGRAYVYRSYGIHALLNAVCEPPGVGAAVLIRALEPLEGIELMQKRRGRAALSELCSGPGKLTQALGIGLEHNRGDLLQGAVKIGAGEPDGPIVASPRIGITKATELRWRFSLAGSPFVSLPRPAVY